MENTELDPIRLKNPGAYTRIPLPSQQLARLPKPFQSSLPFSQVLERRRSASSFPAISDSDLSNFLYGVSSVQQVNSIDGNLQRRYVASMGALHPAHMLIHRPRQGWFVYRPEVHRLALLIVNQDSGTAVLKLAQRLRASRTATLICLLSDCQLASNYYKNYIPLLLRDAGVLLGHASLVAAAHNLSFRILGTTGVRNVETLVAGQPFRSLASGMAMLGGPSQ